MTNPEIQNACKAEIARCLGIARQRYPQHDIPDITLYWATSTSLGKTAGRASYKDNSVELNLSLAALNPHTFIGRTPAHEVAHLVAYAIYGKEGTGHGSKWESMCRLFEISTVKRHSMRTEGEPLWATIL